MINKLKRVPIAIITLIMTTLVFTFVQYDWIFSMSGRFFFTTVVIVVGGFLSAMNYDLKFWKPEK